MTVPGGEPVGRHLPQLLDAERVELRLTALVEREPPHERLRQVAAHAVGRDRHLRADVDARLEGRLLLAVLADAAVAGAHADDAVPSFSTSAAGNPVKTSMPSASTSAGQPLARTD